LKLSDVESAPTLLPEVESMRTVESLIDEAARCAGGVNALGRTLGVTAARIADWRAQRVAVTPETVAELCNVLELPGEESRRLAALAVVNNPKNAGRKEALRRAFFVSWAAGVAIAATVGPTPSNAVGLSETVTRLTLYTS
jgi:hypothetical protein